MVVTSFNQVITLQIQGWLLSAGLLWFIVVTIFSSNMCKIVSDFFHLHLTKKKFQRIIILQWASFSHYENVLFIRLWKPAVS